MQELMLRLGSDCNPLVVHNPRLAIATDEFAQALGRLTAKRKKVLEDHLQISRVEWEGGLYYDEQLGPYIPSTWVASSLWQSAKLSKDGEGLRRATTCSAPDGGGRIAVEYDGPRDIPSLWKDDRYRLIQSIPQGRVRVTRTRPRFVPWTLKVAVFLDDSLMDRKVFEEIAQRAGRSIGIGEKVDGLRCRYLVDVR